MSLILAAAASFALAHPTSADDPTLYPVRLGDPILHSEDTYLSETALAFANATDVGSLQCLDLSQETAGHSRICLTAGEWRAVIDQLVEQASGDRSYALFLTDLEFQRSGQRLDVSDFVPPPARHDGASTDPRQ